MSNMMKVLTDLGVDFSKKEHTHYKFQSKGFMDLIVETWRVDEWLHVSVAHYYVQEGDLMSDPEIEFRAVKLKDINGKVRWDIQPIHYRQDGLGIYQEAMYRAQENRLMSNPQLRLELKNFLRIWATNLRSQGFAQQL